MLTYREHIHNESNARKDQQEQLFEYYTGSHNDVLARLKTIQNISFASDKVVFDLQQAYLNITKKIVKQLAIVYKKPAQRSVIIDGEIDETLTAEYNALLPSNQNTIDKMANRMAELQNTSLTRVDFVDDKIYYDVQSSHLYSVEIDENDPYKLAALSYRRDFLMPNGEYEEFAVVWTKEKHYKVPILNIETITRKQILEVPGDAQPIGENTKMINPYGIIPYAVCRKEREGDFWGTGLMDVVTVNGQINFLLSDLINTTLMQAWGQLVLINANLEESSSKGVIKIGQKYPINIKNQTDIQSDAKFIHASPMLKEVKDNIDWLIKMIALSKGLNPNSFLATVQATSGYSKIIDSLEQMEVREDILEPMRIYEDERFEITKIFLAVHKQIGKSEAVIPDLEGTFLQTKFAEISIPKTPDEEMKETEFDLKHNFISYLDVMKKKYPDLSREELITKLEGNKKDNERFQNVVPEMLKPEEQIQNGKAE